MFIYEYFIYNVKLLTFDSRLMNWIIVISLLSILSFYDNLIRRI